MAFLILSKSQLKKLNRLEAHFCHSDPTHNLEALSQVRQCGNSGTLITRTLASLQVPYQERQGKKSRGYHSHPVFRVLWLRDFLRGKGSS